MAEAKLAPNLPGWMVEHANRYLSSGDTDGHMREPTGARRCSITPDAPAKNDSRSRSLHYRDHRLGSDSD